MNKKKISNIGLFFFILLLGILMYLQKHQTFSNSNNKQKISVIVNHSYNAETKDVVIRINK